MHLREDKRVDSQKIFTTWSQPTIYKCIAVDDISNLQMNRKTTHAQGSDLKYIRITNNCIHTILFSPGNYMPTS